MSKSNQEDLPKRNPLDAMEVYRWSEFKLFCERAGIPWDIGTKKITIELEVGCIMVVHQTYFPRGISSGPNTEGDES